MAAVNIVRKCVRIDELFRTAIQYISSSMISTEITKGFIFHERSQLY